MAGKTSFTAGPWEVERDDALGGCDFIPIGAEGSDGYMTICEVRGNGGTDCIALSEEDRANARLIAAAPTMYSYILRQAENGDEDASRIISSI